jgi:hypothetical protein
MSTSVARQAQSTELAPETEKKRNARFLEAFSGRLDRLTPEQQTAFLMALGRHIGVRAELGELIMYQGKPYVTFDGRLRQAHNTGMFIGMTRRPATSRERQDYRCDENMHLWVSTVRRRGSMESFQGWGEANGPREKNPVAKERPAQMAKKRASYDAVRAAFPVDESISEMHQGYIEEAEELAMKQRAVTPLVAAAYGDPAPGNEDGDDPADASDNSDEVAVVERPEWDAVPRPGEPSTAGSRPITEAQTNRILDLADDPALAGMRDKVLHNLRTKNLTEASAATWIASLEVGISGPPDAGETTGELGLGDARRKPSRSAVENGR